MTSEKEHLRGKRKMKKMLLIELEKERNFLRRKTEVLASRSDR